MKAFYAMILLLFSLTFSGCSQLDKLTWNDMTGEKWLATHSWSAVSVGPLHFILAEPSSTFIVFALGFIILIPGIIMLRKRGESKSKLAWGIALIVWAISTFCAGTSYQAFSYELKCAGRAVCLWTSWWEIWYLMLFVISMNMIAVAVAFSSAKGKFRTGIISYAVLNTVVYLVTVLMGAFKPDQFMASFECMVLFAGPVFIILLAANIIRFFKTHKPLDLLLVGAWILMLLIVVAYFAFYMSGYADVLWQKGVWFNANDVLHIGLIIWVLYFYFAVANKIEDAV